MNIDRFHQSPLRAPRPRDTPRGAGVRRVGFALRLIVSLLVCSAGISSEAAEDRGVAVRRNPNLTSDARTALVIGNSEYAISPLKNPRNDARLVGSTLRNLGFDVDLKTDLNQKQMKRAIVDFGRRLRKNGGVGLFYFAGHGMQVRGENYLIPIGAPIETEADVDVEGVRAAEVMARMDGAQNGMNIVILDACRNNPFARSFRSSSGGLAFMNAPSGTLVAYATAPGDVAADGEGQNGVYTEQLIEAMRKPNQRIEDVFKQTRRGVQVKTNDRQVPWESSSLTGDFYFSREGGSTAAIEKPNKFAPAPRPAKPPPPPTSTGSATRFSSAGKGVVYDRQLGVYWYSPSGRRTYTWNQARERTRDLKAGGRDNWRLPKKAEIESLESEDFADFLKAASGLRAIAGVRYWLDSQNQFGRHLATSFATSGPRRIERRADTQKLNLMAVANE